MTRLKLIERLAQGVFFLDGAMGTQLMASGVEAGTSIVPVNLNAAYSNTADVICMSDETAISQGTVIYDVLVPVETTYSFEPQGLILADTVGFAIDQVEDLAGAIATIEFHFE